MHTKEKQQIIDNPSTCLEIIAINILGLLRISDGFCYILTVQIESTKLVVTNPNSDRILG